MCLVRGRVTISEYWILRERRNTSVRKHVFPPDSVVSICILYLHSFFHVRRFLNFNLIFCVSKLTKVCFRLCSEHGNLCEPHEMVVNGGGQTYHAFLYVSLLNCDLAGFMLDVLELS